MYHCLLTGPSRSEGEGTAWALALPEGRAGLPATRCPFASPRKGSVCFQCHGRKHACSFLHCRSCFCIKTQTEGIKRLLSFWAFKHPLSESPVHFPAVRSTVCCTGLATGTTEPLSGVRGAAGITLKPRFAGLSPSAENPPKHSPRPPPSCRTTPSPSKGLLPSYSS